MKLYFQSEPFPSRALLLSCLQPNRVVLKTLTWGKTLTDFPTGKAANRKEYLFAVRHSLPHNCELGNRLCVVFSLVNFFVPSMQREILGWYQQNMPFLQHFTKLEHSGVRRKFPRGAKFRHNRVTSQINFRGSAEGTTILGSPGGCSRDHSRGVRGHVLVSLMNSKKYS